MSKNYYLRFAIALAQHYPNSVRGVEISRHVGCATSYIEQLARSAKQNGWLATDRGPGGGYVLSNRPDKIMVSQILTFNATPEKQNASDLWLANFNKKINDELSGISLSDIMEECGLEKIKTRKSMFQQRGKTTLKPSTSIPNSVFALGMM